MAAWCSCCPCRHACLPGCLAGGKSCPVLRKGLGGPRWPPCRPLLLLLLLGEWLGWLLRRRLQFGRCSFCRLACPAAASCARASAAGQRIAGGCSPHAHQQSQVLNSANHRRPACCAASAAAARCALHLPCFSGIIGGKEGSAVHSNLGQLLLPLTSRFQRLLLLPLGQQLASAPVGCSGAGHGSRAVVAWAA